MNTLAQEDVRRIYARLAPYYDLGTLFFEAKARRRGLELAAIRDGEAVLEIGVGTGETFLAIARANPHGRNEGIDLTPEMVDRAQARLKRAGLTRYRLRQADARSLDFPDASFDVAVSAYVFDLLSEPDQNRVLAELKRVLRPGGRLSLVNMAPGPRWYHRFLESLSNTHPRWMGGCRPISMAGPVRDAGFTVLHQEKLSQLVVLSEILLATKG